MMMRRFRAFVKAVQMTLRDKRAVPSHFQPLERWMDAGLQKAARVTAAADAHQINRAQRKDIQLKLDGRITSLEQTLEMVRHNLVNVYPRLMQLDDPYSMMVIQSSNINDQYRVSQFARCDAIASAELKQALEELERHLIDLPSIERAE